MISKILYMAKMHLQLEHYNQVKNGIKTIELRLFDEKRKQIKVGDLLQFYNAPNAEDAFNTKIINLHKYPSFKDLCANIDCRKCGFETVEELLESLGRFYPDEKQKELGVVGIEIELCQ